MSLFDKILADAARKGYAGPAAVQAAKWFRTKAKETRGATPTKLMGEDQRLRKKFEIGRMYFFFYDPKHKKTLPYYDRFPLIFPVGPAPQGFYGINLHYLPLTLRAKLMDALADLRTNDRFDAKTKLLISYRILKKASKMKAFEPCFKHYLNRHVRSKYLRIESIEWNIALFLPVERFEKESKETVWADSRRKMR